MFYSERLADATMDFLSLGNLSDGTRIRIDDVNFHLASELVLALNQIAVKEPTRVDPGLTIVMLSDSLSMSEHRVDRDNAINLRNRAKKLLLLVPQTDSVSEGSLDNSFQRLSVAALLSSAIQRQIALAIEKHGLQALRSIATFSHESSAPLMDKWVFWNLLLDASAVDQIGDRLWLLGLLPDSGENFVQRLESNRDTVSKLFGRQKSMSSVSERLERVGLVQGKLSAFLRQALNPFPTHPRGWLQRIAENHIAEASFHLWDISTPAGSDLVAIDINPFITGKGDLAPWSKLLWVDDELIARDQIVVKWKLNPDPVAGASGFRVEVIPALEYRDEGTLSIYEKRVNARTRQHTVNLDIPEDSSISPLYVVRVSVIDENGFPLRTVEGTEGCGESLEFRVESQHGFESELASVNATSILDGALKTALRTGSDTLELDRPILGPNTFSISINSQTTIRIQAAESLNSLQHILLEQADSAGWLRGDGSAKTSFENGDFEFIPVVLPKDLQKKRSALFKALHAQGRARTHPQFANWDEELRAIAYDYLQAYHHSVRRAEGSAREDLLSLDQIRFRFHSAGTEREYVLLPPINPIRLGWIIQFNTLGGAWLERILRLNPSARAKAFDERLLSDLVPRNIPFIVFDSLLKPVVYRTEVSQDYGIYAPVDADDFENDLYHIRHYFDLPPTMFERSELPKRLARRISEFISAMPQGAPLAIHAHNAGDGALIADSIVSLVSLAEEEETASSELRLRVTVSGKVSESSRPVPRLQDLALELERVRAMAPGPFHAGHLELQILEHEAADSTQFSNITVVRDVSHNTLSTIKSEVGAPKLMGLVAPRTSIRSEDGVHTLTTVPSARDVAKLDPDSPLPALVTAFSHAVETTLGIPDGESFAIASKVRDKGGLEKLGALTDWLITVDDFISPNTLEQFDSDSLQSRVVLDHSPDFAEGLGPKMSVSTQSWHQLNRIVQKSMDRLDIEADWAASSRMVKDLSLVSGRLPMAISQSNSDAVGAVGLAVAVRHLKQAGELNKAILLPLDAHLEIFRNAPGENQRCDLALVKFSRRGYSLELIEVKNYSSVDEGLLRRMKRQIDSTYKRLGFISNKLGGEVDQDLQWARWCGLLRFYASRAQTIGLIGSADYLQMKVALERIETDYELPERILKRGIVVNIPGSNKLPKTLEDMDVLLITKADFQKTAVHPESSIWAISHNV